ncbi:MAG: hypothetical protein E7590_03455 [Ruminococcaceae bacterium]|nr:hypothetical protein [Oscillospiraceae bacterium]
MRNFSKKRRYDRALLGAIAVGLCGGCIALSFFPAKRFSAAENRLLAELPTFSAEAVADGSYTAALDRYAAERFPLRGALRQARACYQLLLGQQETGGVLLCTDGSLARRCRVNERAFARNLAAINALEASCGDRLTTVILPRRIDMCQAVLPPLYDTAENEKSMQTVCESCPDALLLTALREDAHWYRTDHHWTTEGAYLAYCELGEVLGYTPHPATDFTPEVVSEHFYGTSHAAAGLPFLTPDHITLYRYEGDDTFTVKIGENRAPFTGFYDFERLQTYDGYGVFFGGNYGYMTVSGAEPRPSLTVIKDSFANALLPFLARHYDLTVIDPRYSTEPPERYCHDGSQLLLLCGLQTLCESSFL